MRSLLRRAFVVRVWRLHRWIYRLTGGSIGGRLVGMPVLLLTTVGRRSGRRHETALTYLPEGRALVVVASNGGAPRHPDWLLNLRTRPEVEVRIGRQRLAVRAREAIGPERERLWARVTRAYRGYAAYQARTRRCIPVVILMAGAPSQTPAPH